MIVELIAVGTELLIGHTVNTNASAVGLRLAESGFDAHYQVTVGDNHKRIVDALSAAAGRADAIVVTGGIGPTKDDLTREALCAFASRTMVRDAALAERIKQGSIARRGTYSEYALRMADRPEGSEPLNNSQGTAPGIALRHADTWIFVVPGVPREMQAILDEEVIPRLRAASGELAVLRSRVIHTWGIVESEMAEILGDLCDEVNPSIAILIHGPEVRVRISAKAVDTSAAEEMIAPVVVEVRRRLGSAVFAIDEQTSSDVISRLAEERSWSFSVCEIGTAGHIGALLAARGSESFSGSMTARPANLSVGALADRARVEFGSDVGLGVSASEVRVEPDGSTVTCLTFAVHTPVSQRVERIEFRGTGDRAMEHAVISGLHQLRLGLEDAGSEASN